MSLKKNHTLIAWVTVLVIMLPIIWPFVSRDSLPVATDAELHVFRMAELERLIRGGELFPRLAPNFYFGFGYPIFNYYAPFAYYLGVIIAFLPGIGPVEATKAVFVIAQLAGALGVFGFTKDRWGTASGIVAAALYGSAPYIQYIDPHARGVLAESLSLGILPLCFFFLGRLITCQQRRYFILSAASVAAFVLSHNLMAMIGSGLMLWWLAHRFYLDSWRPKQSLGWLDFVPLSAFSLGIMASMFFWLPVVLERNLVNLDTLVGEEGSHFSWTSHFLSLQELFSPSLWIDWRASQSAFVFNLGLVQATLLVVLTGFVLWRLIQQRQIGDNERFFWLAAALVMVFFTLPISNIFWRTIPVLPFVQFPWRFLGPAAIAIAIGAGSLFSLFAKEWWLAVGTVAIALTLAMPLAQVPPWQDFGPADLGAVTFQEVKGRWLGTTSTADFLPATVLFVPPPIDEMKEQLYANQLPDRVNRYTLPKTAAATQEIVRPLYFRYTVETDREFPFRLFFFDFPGWKVNVNGERIDHLIGDPEGFIVVPLTAGSHVVDVWFGSTPPRLAGWILTGLALAAAGLIAFMMPLNQSEPPSQINQFPAWGGGLLIGIVAILLLLPSGLFHYASPNDGVDPAEFALNTSFNQQIELLAYDLDKTDAIPGDWVELDLYWQAEVVQEIDFQGFVHLLDDSGNLITQSDKLNPGDFPTRRWTTDKYITDSHLLKLPDDLPTGEYQLTAGLWVMSEGWRLPTLDENGEITGDAAFIATIIVQ
ncbi:MAG: 6-pyruvoyl-tetrahydropterin synthase-related protein [Chloroflexota bacterium]